MKKNKELSVNRSIALNLIASFFAYLVTFGISFFLSPYIVRAVGVDAYGFVSLANNFISYASLITIALNALAGRFITIKIKEKDYDSANMYYTSVFIGNVFLSGILLILAVIAWIFLENIINIPENIFWDVKILFAVLFVNCIINTICSVFGIATFATNKLYLSSIRTIESSLIRAAVLLVLFVFFSPKIAYLGITSLLTGIYCIIYNIYYTKKLTPYLKLSISSFNIKAVKELISSGIWNLVTKLSQILIDGLDLLIANLFIDSVSMGVLSLAKTVPSMISSVVGSMVGSFSPNFTILYAEKKYEELKQSVKQSMKIMGIICNVPIIVLLVCGIQFFTLWQPTQDAKQLQLLSILTCAGLIINGGINCIYNIFTVVNKLKFNSLVLLVSSIISITITFILVKTTDLGIYAIAGVSTCIMIIKNIVLIVPYAAKCLQLKWYAFYSEVIRSALFVIISSIVCQLLINCIFVKLFDKTTWITFFASALIVVFVSLCIGLFVILKKQERIMLFDMIKGRINK